MSAIVEVWCSDCDAPATTEFRLTSGRIVAKCATHGWPLIAPNGDHSGYREARTVNADFARHRMAAVCGVWLQPDGSAVDVWGWVQGDQP